MSIQGMREWVKTHKILIGIILGLLVLSLLLTYSIGSLTKYGDLSGGANQTDYSGFEKALTSERAELEANPTDYSANYNLANTLYEYARQLALSEETENQDKSFEMLKEAAPLYIAALDNAPEELNDLARAQMYTKAAQCYASTNQESVAADYYQEALKLAPADLDTVSAYAQYLAFSGDYDASVQVLNDLIANTDDEATISSAKSLIEQLQALQKSAESKDNAEEGSTEKTEDAQ
ncbi:MAG: hypothetical protein ACOX7J_07475 [Bacillota bacterium]|jgi:tetratricopeptide (TPR) repeat protein